MINLVFTRYLCNFFIFHGMEQLKYSGPLSVTSEYHGDLDFVVGAHEEDHVEVLHSVRVLGW